MAYFDDNDWEGISEENLRYFYEEYSASVRKQLLAKSLSIPTSVYDVLYPRTKEALLAKNVVKISDLEENSKTIRDALIAKLVASETSLDKVSEDTRKSLLARNKILQDANNLLNNSFSVRKHLISKNVSGEGDLLKDSNEIRQNNLSKNKEDISTARNIDSNSESYRVSNLSKNEASTGDLEADSAELRKNSLAKNVPEGTSLEDESASFRNNNLSKNVDTNKDTLESIGDVQRFNNQLKNPAINNTTDKIAEDSESFRDNNISKNIPTENSIDTNSEAYRNKNLSSNIVTESNLEKDSEAIRRRNEAANTSNATDLESSSSQFRDKNISANKESKSNIENDSEEFRANNVSANKPETSDLLSDSETFLKNNVANNTNDSGDLQEDSEEFRKNNTSSNKPSNGDLLGDSNVFLKNNTAANKPDTGDLLTDSAEVLQKNISANKPGENDLLNDSASFLQNNISANKENTSDLLDGSKDFLQNNVSANKSSASDLLDDSQTFLQSNVSANKPTTSDLLDDSQTFFQNNVSANKPTTSDLLLDSEEFLGNNTSANVPNPSDLLLDSEDFLDNNISANVPIQSDLLIDSVPFFDDDMSYNVAGQSDLLEDSEVFLDNNVTPNDYQLGGGNHYDGNNPKPGNNIDVFVDSAGLSNSADSERDSLLAQNIPSNQNVDLFVNNAGLSDSAASERASLLAKNIPSNKNIHVFINNAGLSDSAASERASLLSKNVPNVSNLEVFSKPFRDNNLAHNPSNGLGVVIEGIGTSTFLGISKVMIQGLVLRQVLLAKNKPSKYNLDNFISAFSLEKMSSEDGKNLLFSKNKFQIGKNEYDTTSANLAGGDLGDNKLFGYGYYGESIRKTVENNFRKSQNWSEKVAGPLQQKYGTNTEIKLLETSIGGGFFSVDTVSSKGGYFDDTRAYNTNSVVSSTRPGSITDAIRNYNLSRNLYNLQKITPGDLKSLTTLQDNNDEGFQDLIARTIGFFGGNDSVSSQLYGNLIPRGILVSNEGAYIKGGSPENILRPQQAQGMVIGSPESMMSKTVIGNPFDDEEFKSGRKGLKHLMKTIKNSDAAKFTINYDVQNSKKYVIGISSDGAPKIARQRFTVANPYKPGNAKTLLFSLKNYSSGAELHFPPYIESYSDSYGANWNSTNFLGRPEAVYTYNNSTREGNISFVVLTDYTQNLVIGRDYNSDSLDAVKINPRAHFTSKDTAQNAARELSFNEGEAKQKETNEAKKSLEQFNKQGEANGGTAPSAPETVVLKEDIKSLEKQNNSIQKTQDDSLATSNKGNVYSETNNVIGNINNFMTSVPGRDGGDIDTKAEDSKKRIDEMIKNLAFQPAFFSGDKEDFATKMDFLAKLTRPAAADSGSGFSFTRPPICHIHLGDWWNNDIVIDSVSFNYDDSPWTLDEGRVQPMWAKVTINFKFVGPYRGQKGPPVLSNDKGGFYKDIRRAPSQTPE